MRHNQHDELGRFKRVHADPKEGRRIARRNYEAKPEIRAKKIASNTARIKARRATPEGKAERAAYHRAKMASDPSYRQKRKEIARRRAHDPAVIERRNYLKRLNRSGLPEDLFLIQDTNNKLKKRIHELRRSSEKSI